MYTSQLTEQHQASEALLHGTLGRDLQRTTQRQHAQHDAPPNSAGRRLDRRISRRCASVQEALPARV